MQICASMRARAHCCFRLAKNVNSDLQKLKKTGYCSTTFRGILT